MESGLGILQQALGWLHVLVALVGAGVCALNLGRSRWVFALLGGFAVDGLVSAAFHLSSLLMAKGVISYNNIQGVFLVLSFLGIMGSAAIVGGLALLLGEMGSGSRPTAPGPGSADGL